MTYDFNEANKPMGDKSFLTAAGYWTQWIVLNTMVGMFA